MDSNTEKSQKIEKLKQDKNSVILAHYYVPAEVQAVADYVGDSYYLAEVAARVEQQTICFCGVRFMGESAKLLSPNKRVLLPAKDADCRTDGSRSGVFPGKALGFPPCTPQACMEILDHYGIDCTGKKAVVIGRSLVVGKPAAMMLIKKNATVTICHTRTKDMPGVTREAEILIVAAGRAGVVNKDYVSPGQIVIDVGINVNEEGKLCGDVKFDEVEPIVEAITPVPGGVGSVTTSVLVGHVVEAAMRKYL